MQPGLPVQPDSVPATLPLVMTAETTEWNTSLLSVGADAQLRVSDQRIHDDLHGVAVLLMLILFVLCIRGILEIYRR